MKMQSTEMEFVTFDAQDVIATSGEPNPFFRGDIQSASVKTFNGALNDGAMIFFLYMGGQNKAINLKGSTIDKTNGDTYYVLNSATDVNGQKVGFTINATGTNETPSGEYLDSLGKILDWLTANAQ